MTSTARWAGVAVKGMSSHLGNRAPTKRNEANPKQRSANEMSFFELAHEHVRRGKLLEKHTKYERVKPLQMEEEQDVV